MADLRRVLVQDGTLTLQQAERAVKAAHGGDVSSAALELELADEVALRTTWWRRVFSGSGLR